MSEEITLTVISHDGTERRIAATGWTTIDHKLSIHRGGDVVAEFAPGLWAGLVNEAHQKPGKPLLGQLAEIVAQWEGWADSAYSNYENGDALAGEEARVLRGCASQLRDALGQPS